MEQPQERIPQDGRLYNHLFERGGRALVVRFGEVWWVRNPGWAKDARLAHLKTREGSHPGLSIRPKARLMAFGTSKLDQARRSESRLLEVSPGAFAGSDKPGAFLLDYAVPMDWSEFSLSHRPEELCREAMARLQELLEGPTP